MAAPLTPPSVQQRTHAIITEQLGLDDDEVTPDSSLTDDLGADSLDVVEVVMALEEEFGIEIDDDHAAKWANVRDAVTYIEKELAKRKAQA